MLADKGYLATLPVDPITQKQEWGVARNKNNQVIGVHSLHRRYSRNYFRFVVAKNNLSGSL